MFTSFVSRLITNTGFIKSVIYGRGKTAFFEGKSPKFDVGLNCMMLQFDPIPS
jgi:hypothetical protein